MTLLEAMKTRLSIRVPDEGWLLMLYLEDARAHMLSHTSGLFGTFSSGRKSAPDAPMANQQNT